MRPPQKFMSYPVQWYEGMLLMPQHFQQAEQLHYKLLEYHFSCSFPYHWGIQELKLDTSQLGRGLFRILSLEGIMPDKTVIFFPQDSDEILELDLNEYMSTLQQMPLKIYLCLPDSSLFQDKEGKENVLQRYDSVESSPTFDVYAGQQPIPLVRLRPKLKLIAASTPPARYVSIPLAEISLKEKTFVQSDFVPPLLSIDLKSELGQKVLGFVRRLREKLTHLQGRIQNLSSDALSTDYVEEAVAIRRQLLAGLLPLEAVLYAKGVLQPYELFKALINLASQTATFSLNTPTPLLPSYDHENLFLTFEGMLGFISSTLRCIDEPYLAIAFEQQDRIYSLLLQEEWRKADLIIGFQAPPDMSEGDLRRWVETCVIATDSFVRMVQDNRILGADRTLVQEISHLYLTPSKGMLLCQVAWDNRFLKSSESLRIFNISDTPEARPKQISLYITEESARMASSTDTL